MNSRNEPTMASPPHLNGKRQKLTANDVETKKTITLQYDSQVKGSTSKNSIAKIIIGGKQFVQPTQSFLRFIETAQDLEVTRKQLPQVHEVYVKHCMPELQGQIVVDENYTQSNWAKII